MTPTTLGAAISGAVKAVLIALVATGVLPWDEPTSTAVAVAVTALVDVVVIFIVIRPKVTPVDNPKAADGTPLVPARD